MSILNLAETVAIRQLLQGKVVVHATEGVFGLGCRALDRDACGTVAALKSRDRHKPFIVVAAEFSQIAAMIDAESTEFDPDNADWPGPETWVLPASTSAPRWLRGADRTIAVRVSAHPQMAMLCRAVGPIVSTSANPPGRKPALSLLEARRYFGDAVGFYLQGRLITPGRPSRIRDGRTRLPIRA